MATENKPVNLSYVLFLCITAALGGLLFGFDIAIITGAGPFLESHFKLGHLSLGWAFSSLLFPFAFNAIGKAPTFAFLASMSLLHALFAWRFVPETKGKTLEEIENYWNKGGETEKEKSGM